MRKKKYIIVFLGTDGSGKSTVIKKLKPFITDITGYKIQYEHLRPNYIPSLGVALGKRTKEEEVNNGPSTDPHALPPSGFGGSLIRLSYYMIDYTYGYFMKVSHSKNVVWIFDRYYYDYYIDQKRARLSLPSWIIKLYGLFIPKPDLIMCLGGEPEKIYSRKPETSIEEVARQVQKLKKICENYENAYWVDTTTTIDETISNAEEIINRFIP